jgi:hypothetical protein
MYDVATGHLGGIIAPLVLGPLAWLILRGLPGYRSAEAVTRAASVLLLITGFVHLGLVPAHLSDTPITAVLFLIDGLGFIGLAIAAFTVSWWRGAAAWWLGATIVAYLVWVIAGRETPKQVGIACKLVELVALGLLMRLRPEARTSWPRRAWRASRLPLITVITTLGIFIGGLAHPDALHAHAGAVLQPANPYATAAQQAAAARLLNEVRAALTPYQDPRVAIAAGFKPGLTSNADPLLHWENKANAGVILDPTRPQDLVYLHTPKGLMLLGAMYQMPKIGQWGPDPGGPLTQWHQHEGICFSPFGVEFSFATPFWGCPVGAISVTPPPMLHVWVVDNPKGAFSADFDATRQRTLEGR